MTYWVINTDKLNGISLKAYDIWYKTEMAFAGDNKPTYDKHKGFFKRVSVGDYVFMYQSGEGIVGLGEIVEEWDGKTYTKAERLFYSIDEFEYRIAVDWKPEYDTRNNPLIGKEYLPYRGYHAKIDPKKWDVEKVKKLLRERRSS
ncbi:MAG: EVE domain-containing protein [Melioribacteraceae bacterium]|nr:EVE domain-containing protein [Melioribacteraceae bacterium]MCF8431956.1 EVE domain-containing protein [Melioribacteraceae bacterium]